MILSAIYPVYIVKVLRQ